MRQRIGAMTGLVVAGLLLAGCGEAGGAEVPQTAEQAVRTINVEVAEVQPQDFTHFVRVVGTVEAERDVTVSAEEGGVVERLLAAKGEAVAAGQALVKLDDDVLRAQLDQAESQAALAEEQWQRQKRLWEQDSVGTEIQYLQAKYNARTAAANAQVLRERLARTWVRAPVAGVLDDRMVEVGTMVSPGAPVARLLDVDTVEVVAGVPERYAPDIESGAGVVVNVDALAGREYDGRVDFVGSAVDRDNRTFEVEIVVPNP
ncbi:MAG: efflux RND transporter periplasmic adaptor subunit, partial [Longimicrobiales bacterium]|nr:efflux RND transporter periplasmic adaptor subunit [Longimicrobiales bacterium]